MKDEKEIKENKTKDLSSVVRSLEKKYGSGIVITNNEFPDIVWTPSGSIALDSLIGGGLPAGRIMEVYGQPGGGKSTVALIAAATYQKLGKRVAYIETEGAFSAEWARRNGVDMDNLTLSQPDSAEQVFDILEAFVTNNLFDLIIVDSVASMLTEKEADLAVGDAVNQMALLARFMSIGLKKLTMLVSKSKCNVMFINQTRENVGVMYGDKTTTPGGQALKFYSSVRLAVRRVKDGDVHNDHDDVIGHRLHISNKKNKVGVPFKETEFTILYDKGPDNVEGLVALAISKSYVKQSGPSYSINMGTKDDQKFLGLAALVEAVKTDEMIRAYLIKKLNLDAYYVDAIAKMLLVDTDSKPSESITETSI